MACGRLVMVAENGTMPELVGDAGITFPPNDVHSLALALERVFDRPELVHRFGFKAAQRASRSLSVAAQVEKMTTVFDRLTHGAVSKPSPQKRSDIAELATKERIDE
jgi:glycosyltransferase involved in cell wall biosynthesis